MILLFNKIKIMDFSPWSLVQKNIIVGIIGNLMFYYTNFKNEINAEHKFPQPTERINIEMDCGKFKGNSSGEKGNEYE